MHQKTLRAGTANRIRALRIRAGKSQADMAQRLGLNIAWYADLESRDEELASTLTIFKAMELASLLGVTLHELLDEPPLMDERIALMDLPERILAHAKRQGLSVEQMQERLGWELREFLDTPLSAAAELPIQFFRAVAATLGINWLALVPDEL
jgi:transcriptional regulator with XRE-family HTH domain